jgi:pyruvate dehydrogenase E2 component (dihydrolipoyllysine-residue acetyltransferase)
LDSEEITMAVDVIMPQMGESIFEGTITKWLKKPGDKIDRDEPLFEISTDKVDAEIPSPAAGVLKEIKVSEGQTVPVQTVVGTIDAAGAGAAAAAPAAAKPATASAQPKSETPKAAAHPPPSQPAAAPAAKAAAPASSAPPAAPAQKPAGNGDKVRSSPLVRRIAREHSIDLSQVSGTGAGGRVSKRDILAAVETGGSPAATPSAAIPPPSAKPAPGAAPSAALEAAVPRERMYFGHYEVQPMSIMRQRIAEHMVLSKRTSPHVYSIEEVDVTGLVSLRAKLKEKFESETGTKLTYMPFFIRAAVEGLRAFPTVNSSVDGTNVVLHKECNIGMAVALDWGLIVPVIKSAEEKNFLGLARAVNDLAERARNKKLKPDEVQESTFSTTNPGVFGGLFGLPVINQPNVAILGLGTIEKRPVVIDDAIAIRSMVYLTLSYDHRIVDGAVAHQFMGHMKRTLQNWTEPIM